MEHITNDYYTRKSGRRQEVLREGRSSCVTGPPALFQTVTLLLPNRALTAEKAAVIMESDGRDRQGQAFSPPNRRKND